MEISMGERHLSDDYGQLKISNCGTRLLLVWLCTLKSRYRVMRLSVSLPVPPILAMAMGMASPSDRPILNDD